jgi:hypothetical protein
MYLSVCIILAALVAIVFAWFMLRKRKKPAAQVFRGNFKKLAERSKHRD